MDDTIILKQLEAQIKAKVPTFEIRYKDESRFMRVLGVLLYLFNREFMTRFTTTIGTKVYFPSRRAVAERPQNYWEVLAHEYVHILDYEQHKLWFKLSYLLPQALVVGALGAFFSPWFLVALLALAPWPAPWRVHWELRGYTMSMAVNYWAYGGMSTRGRDRIGENFWGWNYYKMAWGKERIRVRLAYAVDDISSDRVLQMSPAFGEVKAIIESQREQVA